MKRPLVYFVLALFFYMFSLLATAHAATLKPFVLGNTPAGDMAAVVSQVESALTANNFTLVGRYAPFAGATVICASHAELTAAAAAAAANNGAFGIAQRVSVTEVNGQLQVAYMNPAYLAAAYGLGKLPAVSTDLGAALGAVAEFGAKGVEEANLAPGKYHYAPFMPYFKDVMEVNSYPDHKTGVETVEKNLAAKSGGTEKVYRIDVPGQEISVFGIGIPVGDGPDTGAKDTDKEVLDIIDYQEYRATAYLPYELMVTGNRAIALPGRFRIAVHFPDTSMAGEHGFTKIMSSPGGILKALEAVAGK